MATSMEEIEKVFKRIDKDGDGKISISELGEILRSLGANTSSEEVARIMAKFDTDGDGSIDLKEFVKIRNGGDGDGVIDLLFHK